MGAQPTYLVDYWFKLDVDGLAEHLEADHGLTRLEAWSEAILRFREQVLALEERRLLRQASGSRAKRTPKAPPGETPPSGTRH
jgi:hypothetical protein